MRYSIVRQKFHYAQQYRISREYTTPQWHSRFLYGPKCMNQLKWAYSRDCLEHAHRGMGINLGEGTNTALNSLSDRKENRHWTQEEAPLRTFTFKQRVNKAQMAKNAAYTSVGAQYNPKVRNS